MTKPSNLSAGWPGRKNVGSRRLRTSPGASISATATSTTTTATTPASSGRAASFPPVSVGVSLNDLHHARLRARANKKPSHDQLTFENDWLDNLLALKASLNKGTWAPSPTTCFIAQKPKAREIHAPAFGDHVVHHLLVPQLEALFALAFIYDSFSNRVGKGTHAAVERVRNFARQVCSGQGGGWFLQLDISRFFNSIDRKILWAELKPKMIRCGTPEVIQRAAHALLRTSPVEQGVIYRATAAERASVPMHKRLENAGPGRGLPIGNLSSQFFANVYMAPFDDFVKHKLKAKRYARYVDDFVLIHKDRAQLEAWLVQIREFLDDRLKLRLKADIRLRPLSDGIDFLGYVVKPTHTLVRRRVISHAREKLSLWERSHVGGGHIKATPEQYRNVCSIWGSYAGHFSHANARGLIDDFMRRYPWLPVVVGVKRTFHYRLEGRTVFIRFNNSLIGDPCA